MQPKVFIIQQPLQSKDYSSAQRYGTLHFLLNGEHSPSQRPSDCILRIGKTLREEFDYQRDYITWSGGDPLANLMAGIVIGVLRVPKIKFLRWERERSIDGARMSGNSGFYTPVEIKCY